VVDSVHTLELVGWVLCTEMVARSKQLMDSYDSCYMVHCSVMVVC
jgi:hypothetical protein